MTAAAKKYIRHTWHPHFAPLLTEGERALLRAIARQGDRGLSYKMIRDRVSEEYCWDHAVTGRVTAELLRKGFVAIDAAPKRIRLTLPDKATRARLTRGGNADMLVHARRRVKERLGLKLNKNLRASIICQILSGRAKFIGTGHDATRTKWGVIIDGRFVCVVYCEREREICTVLPVKDTTLIGSGGRRR